MTALAELLVKQGAQVCGSDVDDVFYTDAILRNLHIPVFNGFNVANFPEKTDIVVYSAAYNRETHPELVEASRRELPILEYTEALGAFSAHTDSSGVSGVHGKTTTTGMAGTIVKSLGLHGSVLVGSGVANFDGGSTYAAGSEFFIAETCEYRRHFLRFHPNRIIMTSLEPDHLDYFKDYEDMARAFVEYAGLLPEGGTFIYCADDTGASDVAARLSKVRNDLAMVPYGFTAQGDFRIEDLKVQKERQIFSLPGFRTQKGNGQVNFSLRVPGRHNVLNATAAVALVTSIYNDRVGSLSPTIVHSMVAGLDSFRGCKRRSEILGEAKGILFMDDYAHHPTAIRTTLEGYRDFFPGRRIVVDFMSHTYSRTRSLFEEFASAFGSADVVLLHDVYPSAREVPEPDDKSLGKRLFDRVKAQHGNVQWIPDVENSSPMVESFLKKGDLFVTMGAGDNWKIGSKIHGAWTGTRTPMDVLASLRSSLKHHGAGA